MGSIGNAAAPAQLTVSIWFVLDVLGYPMSPRFGPCVRTGRCTAKEFREHHQLESLNIYPREPVKMVSTTKGCNQIKYTTHTLTRPLRAIWYTQASPHFEL